MRSLVLLVAAFVVVLCVVPLWLGVWLLITPRRAGHFLNESFAIFPSVERDRGGQHWFYRALGIGCVALSVYFFSQLWDSLVLPVMRGLQ